LFSLRGRIFSKIIYAQILSPSHVRWQSSA